MDKYLSFWAIAKNMVLYYTLRFTQGDKYPKFKDDDKFIVLYIGFYILIAMSVASRRNDEKYM